MTNPTSNFGWQMPTSTDLVTDLPADFAVFGQAVDTSMADLKGGTTGQILSKATNTDMDFTWVTNDVGDTTAVNTTAPLQGGATSGAVTLSIDAASTTVVGAVQLEDSTSSTSTTKAATPNSVKSAYDLANGAIAKSTVTTAGDIVYRNATVPTRLGIGTANQVLTVNAGATAPEWKTPAATSPTFVGCSIYNSTTFSLANNTTTRITMNSEFFDTNGFHSTSTDTARITVPTGYAGKYLVATAAKWETSSTGWRHLELYKNNASLISMVQIPGNGTINAYDRASIIISLAEGDFLELFAWQNSGGALSGYFREYEYPIQVQWLGA